MYVILGISRIYSWVYTCAHVYSYTNIFGYMSHMFAIVRVIYMVHLYTCFTWVGSVDL